MKSELDHAIGLLDQQLQANENMKNENNKLKGAQLATQALNDELKG